MATEPGSSSPDQAPKSETADLTPELEKVDSAPDQPPAAGASGRKPMKRTTRIRLLVLGGLVLVIALVFIGRFVLDTRTYVTTDNAQIDGNQILINAPATGTLIDWDAPQGTAVASYQQVGRIALQAGYGEPQVVIRAPAAGTIAVSNAVTGSFVTVGSPLAIAYDGSGVFVTARVDETQIDQVHVGAAAKIEVDAFPDAKLTGHVSAVKTGAAGVFSLLPQSNTSGNFQKVTQVIPVTITIDDRQGLALVPGMSVTVKIRR